MTNFLSNLKAKHEERKHVAQAGEIALQEKIQVAEDRQWPDQQSREIAERYQEILGIQGVISEMKTRNPSDYLNKLTMGYFNPIPQAWCNDPNSPLTVPYTNCSGRDFDDAAEERMYWVLNNAHHPGQSKLPTMKPDEQSEQKMAKKRMSRAEKVDTRFMSDHDAFRNEYGDKGYTKQVKPAPLHKEFVELALTHHGGVGIDTMILLDTSGSMGWDTDAQESFMRFRCGETQTPGRFWQPRHIKVVESLLSRAMHFTGPRDHYTPRGEEQGIATVAFNNYGIYIGRLNTNNFHQKWNQIEQIVSQDQGTQVMSGWQQIKKMHFEKHGAASGAWNHPVYGWQTRPDMVKLSLLMLLDGEAYDMDEFELELMGETWAYVTILLIGGEECVHHNRHANELDRVARSNPRIQFFDCQGRIAERLILHEVMQAMYPVQPPSQSESLQPEYDHPPPLSESLQPEYDHPPPLSESLQPDDHSPPLPESLQPEYDYPPPAYVE